MKMSTIFALCAENRITISALEKELGLSKSSIMRWEKSVPKIDNVQKVADYFDVSVDFLLKDHSGKFDEFIEEVKEHRENRRLEKRKAPMGRRQEDLNVRAILEELSAILKNYGGNYLPQDNKKIPVVGTIKCGPNGIAYEDIDDYIMIDESLHGDFLALRTRGDSMTGAGIDDGDLAIIRLQDDVESGEIAAVLIGEEATLKRVIKSPIGIALEGASPSYKTRYFTGEEANSIRIIGKLVEIRKRF